jgi:hypothetical protein
MTTPGDIVIAVVSIVQEPTPAPTDDIDFGTAWKEMTIREFGAVTIKDLYKKQGIALSIIIGGFAKLDLGNVGSIMDLNMHGYSSEMVSSYVMTRGNLPSDSGFYGSLLTCVLSNVKSKRPETPMGFDYGDAFRDAYLKAFPWSTKTTDENFPSFEAMQGATGFFSSFSNHVKHVATVALAIPMKMAMFIDGPSTAPPAIAFTKQLVHGLCKKENEDLVWSAKTGAGSIRDEILLEVAAVLSSKPYEKGEFIRPLKMIMQVSTSPVWPAKDSIEVQGPQTPPPITPHYVIHIPTAFRVSKVISRDLDTVLSNCNVGNKSPEDTLALFHVHPRRTELVNLVAHATVFVTKLRRDTAIGSRLISPQIFAHSSREQQAAYVKIHDIMSGGSRSKRRRGILPVS